MSHIKLINKGGKLMHAWKSKKPKNSMESAKVTLNSSDTNYLRCSFGASRGVTNPCTEQIRTLLLYDHQPPWISDLVSAIKPCWIMVDTKPWAIRNKMRFFSSSQFLDFLWTTPRLARGWLEWGPLGLPGASPLLSSFRMAWLSGTWGHYSGLLKPLNHRPQLWPGSVWFSLDFWKIKLRENSNLLN